MKYIVEKTQGEAFTPYSNDPNACWSLEFTELEDALQVFEQSELVNEVGVFSCCSVESVSKYDGKVIERKLYIERGFDNGKAFRKSRLRHYR